jgi:hypothetical protein
MNYHVFFILFEKIMKLTKLLSIFGSFFLIANCYAYAAPNHPVSTFVQVNYDDATLMNSQIKEEKKEDLFKLNNQKAPDSFDENRPNTSVASTSNDKNNAPNTQSKNKNPDNNFIKDSSTPMTAIMQAEANTQASANGQMDYTAYDTGYDQEGYDFKQTELYSQIQCFSDICKYTLLPNVIKKATIHIEKLDTAKILFRVNDPFYFEVKNQDTQATIKKTMLSLKDLNDNDITLVAGKMRTTLNIDFTNYTQEAYTQKSKDVNENLFYALITLVGGILIGLGVYWYLEEDTESKH